MAARIASRLGRVLLLLGVCLGIGIFVPQSDVERAAMETADLPNIVFVLTDDLDVDSVRKVPSLQTYMSDRGTTFTNTFVTYSLCCPSRSTILTGQYPHNHLVRSNGPPLGGFKTFHRLGREKSTLATWLDGAGYETALFGKYLNGYGKWNRHHVPVGWDEWYGFVGDTTLNQNGEVVKHQPDTYIDDTISGLAQDFVRRQEGEDAPFFVYLSVHAPHAPATPDRRHETLFDDLGAPRTPSFNEADVSDKPRWLRGPPLDSEEISRVDRMYRDRLRTITAVGEMLDGLLTTLEETGELDDTYIVLTSDNGYHLGQHRLGLGKETPYEEDIRIPLIVRGPGVPAGVSRDEMILNNDFAPTFTDLAGLPSPATADGRSFASLLDEKSANDPAAWRTAFEVRHWVDPAKDKTPYWSSKPIPPYRAVRTKRYLYVEYQTGEHELYDLEKDPHELHNLYDTADQEVIAGLEERLDELGDCSGKGCHAAENGSSDPGKPG